jgi:hypothetical protein
VYVFCICKFWTNQHESVLLPRVVQSLGCRCCHSRDGVRVCGGSAVDGVSSVADSHAAKRRKGMSAAHPLMPILLLPRWYLVGVNAMTDMIDRIL